MGNLITRDDSPTVCFTKESQKWSITVTEIKHYSHTDHPLTLPKNKKSHKNYIVISLGRHKPGQINTHSNV